jgi:hypothetical protein
MGNERFYILFYGDSSGIIGEIMTSEVIDIGFGIRAIRRIQNTFKV